jgi:hypothetical protein
MIIFNLIVENMLKSMFSKRFDYDEQSCAIFFSTLYQERLPKI